MKQRESFLRKIREELLAKRSELTVAVEGIAKESASGERQVMDSADEASSATMSKIQNSLQETGIGELKLIDEALGRMEKGEYGVCVGCGEHISAKRLEHYPYAPRCITCQEMLES